MLIQGFSNLFGFTLKAFFFQNIPNIFCCHSAKIREKRKENISLIIELSLFFNLVMHPKWQACPDRFCLMSPVDDFLSTQKE